MTIPEEAEPVRGKSYSLYAIYAKNWDTYQWQAAVPTLRVRCFFLPVSVPEAY
jgi:hypothetical protein